ncbi:MAG: hypothetical protein AAGG00_07470 [Cyanobacteria bacterium P01_H01_bin.150]
MSIDCQKRLDKFIESVEAAQKLQNDIVRYGLEAAYLYAASSPYLTMSFCNF